MATHSSPTQVIAGVTVLATPIIKKAVDLAQKHLEPIAYSHVIRSWLYSSLIVSKLSEAQRTRIDYEVISLSAILHDLGWSLEPEIRTADKIFEVDGANAARTFILQEGEKAQWNKHRVQLVWDSIALHTNPSIAAHKELEVFYMHVGIMIELFGVEFAKQNYGGLIQIDRAESDQIAAELPRVGLRGCLKETMCGFCREKAAVTCGTWVGDFGDRFVEGYSFEGKQVVDLIMGVLQE